MILAAARTSLLLSLLFLLVYPSCNWITSLRSGVGTCHGAWERHIPFVPAMIIPYLSIDLFFIAAPFLCADRRELSTFARRVAFAILAAAACFLLWPLRLAVERPAVAGMLGVAFDAFRALDQPYNLVPSLHITLVMVLGEIYARHTRGILRLALSAWFCLVGISALLTHQHHVADVVGGFVLGVLVLYLFRESPARLPVVPDRRLGSCYALGSVAAAALSAATWPGGGILLWPSLSLGIVAAAYFGCGPGVFRKENGRLPPSARLLLAPYLLGQAVSLLYYRRQCRSWDEVAPGLLVGRKLNDREAEEAVRQGVTAVLDLTGEFSEARPFLGVEYRNLAVLDLTAPTREQLREAAAFIAGSAARGTVYVHCKIGYSRSAAAAGASPRESGRAAAAAEAVALLKAARPSIVIRPEALAALREFAEAG
jgi:hypothetical protein